jgi:type 1 fimbria pilin
MKKPALLLSLLMVLLTLPAQAEMIVNDHFEGSSLDPAWNVSTTPNTSGWNYSVQGSQIKTDNIGTKSSADWGRVYLSQRFDPIDDFNAQVGLSWESPNLDSIQGVGIALYNEDRSELISGVFYLDGWVGGYGGRWWAFGDQPDDYHYNPDPLPLNGSGTASMVRENGLVNISWNGSLLASAERLAQAAILELSFHYHPWYGQSPMGTMSVDYVTLEGDPVDLSATPEPGTMMLLGSALGLGAWWQMRRRRNKQA